MLLVLVLVPVWRVRGRKGNGDEGFMRLCYVHMYDSCV